jgi:multiple sugar transport system substrate-binding protein
MALRISGGLLKALSNQWCDRRGFIAGAMAVAGSTLFSGGGDAATTAHLRISWWGSDDRNKKTIALINQFEKRNPGLTMTPEYGGLIGYQDKLDTEFAGGHAPDIMQLAGASEPALVKARRLLALDPYIGSGALNLSDANKSVLAISKLDDKLYGLPWGLACGCFFLDTKLFQDARVDLPVANWTWDDYARTAKALSKANPKGVYGSADIWAPAGTQALAPFEFFLRENGKFAFTPEGKLGFGKSELTEWLAFWDDLRKAGAVTPAEITALESGYETSPLVTGRASMYPINSSIASSLQGLAPHNLACLPIPTGMGSTVLHGTKYGPFINASLKVYVNARTKYPALAIDFLNYITNDPDAAKIHLMARGVPLSASITKLILPDISAAERSMVNVVDYVQARESADYVPWPISASQIQNLMQQAHQQVAFGQSSVPQAVTRFFDEADAISQ